MRSNFPDFSLSKSQGDRLKIFHFICNFPDLRIKKTYTVRKHKKKTNSTTNKHGRRHERRRTRRRGG